MFLMHFLFLYFMFIISYSQNTDIELLRKIYLNRNPKLDNTFRFITNTRGFISGGVIAGMTAYTYIKKDSTTLHKTITIASSLLATTSITLILKYIINRDRPFKTYSDIENLSFIKSQSFPSGHTSEAFSTATTLSIEYHKWYIIAPIMTWATAAGYSRMHLGVHYPSDVLAGAIIGSGSAFFSHWINQKIQYTKKHVKPTY